jgi:protein PhnA
MFFYILSGDLNATKICGFGKNPYDIFYLPLLPFKLPKTFKMEVKDSNGTLLSEGDSVKIIKDLKVKGSSATLKRGTLVKNIRLTDDAEEIEGKVEKSVMVLKTMFLQKV